MPNSFSIFLIYERNQALGSGHTDKIHVAIGYLPNKENNYALSIDGSEGLVSKFKIKKILMILILISTFMKILVTLEITEELRSI